MRCVLVVGSGRSGTSCIAGIMHHLGIDMGNKLYPGNHANPTGFYEDMYFRQAAQTQTKKWEMVGMWADSRIVKGQHIWGLKHPSLCDYARGVVGLLETKAPNMEIRILRVNRDLESVLNSCASEFLIKTKEQWRAAIVRSLDNRDSFLSEFKGKWTTVFYEDVLKTPYLMVSKIMNFCFEGSILPLNKVESAINFIDPKLCKF